MPAEPPGAEPAQQGLQADVHPHEVDGVTHLGQVQVRGPDHLDLVGVHELVIQDVPGQQDLPLAPLEFAQVQAGGAQGDGTAVQPVDGRGVEEGPPAPDAHDHSGDERVGLAAMHLGQQVSYPADLVAGLVDDGSADEPGQRYDVLPELARCDRALGRLDQAAGQCGMVTVPAVGVAVVEEEPIGHSSLLGPSARPC